MLDDWAATLGLLLMILGFAGVFVPFLPGVPIMLLGAWVYSWLTGWDVLTWPWLLLMMLLTVASLAFDFLASAWAARRFGASRRAAASTVVGTLLGVVFLGAWGALVGGMSGAVLGELAVQRRLRPALKSGSGAFVGFVLTLIADVLIALILLTIYLTIVL
ncbi:MAG: DUF456 domain-containing protein [Chloroflexota bacterium]|nr:DUF456 domain-containing protein [Chloroflexota bacterium]